MNLRSQARKHDGRRHAESRKSKPARFLAFARFRHRCQRIIPGSLIRLSIRLGKVARGNSANSCAQPGRHAETRPASALRSFPVPAGSAVHSRSCRVMVRRDAGHVAISSMQAANVAGGCPQWQLRAKGKGRSNSRSNSVSSRHPPSFRKSWRCRLRGQRRARHPRPECGPTAAAASAPQRPAMTQFIFLFPRRQPAASRRAIAGNLCGASSAQQLITAPVELPAPDAPCL
jgi:hypothetical protein